MMKVSIKSKKKKKADMKVLISGKDQFYKFYDFQYAFI